MGFMVQGNLQVSAAFSELGAFFLTKERSRILQISGWREL
jgi:hypothetical protein